MSQSSYLCIQLSRGTICSPKLTSGGGSLSQINAMGHRKPFRELCGMNRAELSHPAAVLSDLLCWQTGPLSPEVTDALDCRAQGTAAIASVSCKGTWFCTEVLAHRWRRKEFLMEQELHC